MAGDVREEGGCLCGDVRYVLVEEPLAFYACHCRDCQRQTGSAFGLSMVVRAEAVELVRGEAKAFRVVLADGREKRGRFCTRCAARLWGEPSKFAGVRILRPGTLDEPGRWQPYGDIWTASARPGAAFHDGPKFEGQPADPLALVRAWQGRRGPGVRGGAAAEVEVSDSIDPRDLEFLDERITAFNYATTGVRDGRRLVALLRDADGATCAGLAGHTWGGCCDVKLLWVAEGRRLQGLGSRLLAAAEREARDRGCSKIVLSTHSFQAPGFYEKRGYRVAGRFADYPRGGAQIFLEKAL